MSKTKNQEKEFLKKNQSPTKINMVFVHVEMTPNYLGQEQMLFTNAL